MFGKFTAILFINKFYNGCYNVIYPPQSIEWARKNVYVKILLILTGSWKEEDELYWIIIEQYATALIMGILISLNTKSFMRNLLTSLKRILSETSLIKTSYNTNILIFTFVRYIISLILNSCSALTTCRRSCSWAWTYPKKKENRFRICSTSSIMKLCRLHRTCFMWYHLP